MVRRFIIATLLFSTGPLVGIGQCQTAPAPPPPPPPVDSAPAEVAAMQAGDEATSDCDPAAAARVGVLETLVTKQRTYIKALEARIRHLQGH
ncbi:hypothetical protein [Sphingomonas psychrolutea]|uniref:Uncharacterized protein n=1 Tax=Sphingomonas psychrolutea TaxID=1259676 RepID=A0ABQ1H4A3_9SPHN|nr:hypothetical protein [Sphingomonas psychrolutea]GGA57140.1 hypothetical protein GCM10011395_29460 [Sphingomonas psychrolutea]